MSGGLLSNLYTFISIVVATILKDKSVYKINTIEYKKRISETTNGVISESTILANDFVRSKYLNTVNEAEVSLSNFIDRYITIIEKEISTRQANITDIPQRILNIESDIQDTQEILKTIFSIKESIEKIK